MGEIARKIEEAMKKVEADPEVIYQEALDNLVAQHGQAWVDAHKSELEYQWLAAQALWFGMDEQTEKR